MPNPSHVNDDFLDIKGIGVLLRGSSGVGKSECALALIERGHSLVADDLTVTLPTHRPLTAAASLSIRPAQWDRSASSSS